MYEDREVEEFYDYVSGLSLMTWQETVDLYFELMENEYDNCGKHYL